MSSQPSASAPKTASARTSSEDLNLPIHSGCPIHGSLFRFMGGKPLNPIQPQAVPEPTFRTPPKPAPSPAEPQPVFQPPRQSPPPVPTHPPPALHPDSPAPAYAAT